MTTRTITYEARKLENARGGTRAIEQRAFTDVEKAIEFVEKQRNTEFAWWEIHVQW